MSQDERRLLRLPLKKGSSVYAQCYWRDAPPFIENSRATLIHRPREVTTYKTGKTSHIGVHYWCHNACTGRKNITFLNDIPQDRLLCETCERNAVDSGLPSANELIGRHAHLGRCRAVKVCCSAAAIGEQMP